MNLAQEFGALAREMLEEFGADAQLIRTAPPAPTPVGQEGFNKRAGRYVNGGGSPTSRPVATRTTVRVSIQPETTLGVDGRLLVHTIATLLVEPREGDQLALGGTTWTVGQVTKIAPQGVAIAYRAEVS